MTPTLGSQIDLTVLQKSLQEIPSLIDQVAFKVKKLICPIKTDEDLDNIIKELNGWNNASINSCIGPSTISTAVDNIRKSKFFITDTEDDYV